MHESAGDCHFNICENTIQHVDVVEIVKFVELMIYFTLLILNILGLHFVHSEKCT